MIRFYSAVLLCFFIGCNTPVSDSASKSSLTVLQKEQKSARSDRSTNELRAIKKEKIIGAWTDGNSENASFDISKDSIYYADQLDSFPYVLKDDTITIFYPDMIFKGRIHLQGDTLILKSAEFGESRFTRFKN